MSLPWDERTGQHLVDVHDGMRAELERLRGVVDEVGEGEADHWTLGAFCQSYCRAVTGHHTLEGSSVFPHLGRADQRLGFY